MNSTKDFDQDLRGRTDAGSDPAFDDNALATAARVSRDERVQDEAGQNRADRQTLLVAEESARIDVVRQDAGGVRVSLVTEPVESVERVEVASERVEVTRHPFETEIDAIPEPRTEGDVTILPVVEERAVVVTRLFLTEEIHIRRVRSTETVEVPVNLRRQRAVVEQLTPDPIDPGSTDPVDRGF